MINLVESQLGLDVILIPIAGKSWATILLIQFSRIISRQLLHFLGCLRRSSFQLFGMDPLFQTSMVRRAVAKVELLSL